MHLGRLVFIVTAMVEVYEHQRSAPDYPVTVHEAACSTIWWLRKFDDSMKRGQR